MQKRVSAGQRINGNISARAMNELGKMIQERSAARLSKGGKPIEMPTGPGIFVVAKNGSPEKLARGEWVAIDAPLFSVTDREDRWPLETEVITGNLNSSTIVVPVFAMATETIASGTPGVFQIAGLGRTKIWAPPGDPQALITAYYDGGASNPRLLTGSDSPVGPIDVVWHDGYEGDPENGVEVWALVRWPGSPRAGVRPFTATGPMGEGDLDSDEANVAWNDDVGGFGVVWDQGRDVANLASGHRGWAGWNENRWKVMGVWQCEAYS